MKKCPYCAEEIQDEAIKCKFCGENIPKPVNKIMKKATANTCPKCLKEYDDTWKVCLDCGIPLIKKDSEILVKDASVEIKYGNIKSCPKCKSEDIKKVSIVYETGVITTQASIGGLGVTINGGGIAGVGGFGASSKGKDTSLLAQKLTPPNPNLRDHGSDYATVIVFVFIGVGFILSCIVWSNTTNESLLAGAWAVSTVISILLGLIFYPKIKAQKEAAKKTYQEESEKWNSSWICMRCGEVFLR